MATRWRGCPGDIVTVTHAVWFHRGQVLLPAHFGCQGVRRSLLLVQRLAPASWGSGAVDNAMNVVLRRAALL